MNRFIAKKCLSSFALTISFTAISYGQTAPPPSGEAQPCCANPNNKVINIKPWFQERFSIGNEPLHKPNPWQRRYLPTYLSLGLKKTKAVGYDVKASSGADFSNCCITIHVKQEVLAQHKPPHRAYTVSGGYVHITGCLNPGEQSVIAESLYRQFTIIYYDDIIDGRTRMDEFIRVFIHTKDKLKECDRGDFDFWLQ